MGDIEGLKTSAEEVTAEAVDTAREWELAAVTELLQPSAGMNRWRVVPYGWGRMWFPERDHTPGEDAAKTDEMTTNI